MYYLQSRYYDPTLCRYLNPDVVFDYDVGIPGYNLFAYCGNSPIFRVDISGRDSEPADLDETNDQIEEKEGGRSPSPPTGGFSSPTSGGGRSNTTKVFRSVSSAEAEGIKNTGKFSLNTGSMESKQFAFNANETAKFGKFVSQSIIVSAELPTNTINFFCNTSVDSSIFRHGTLTVYAEQLDLFNSLVSGCIISFNGYLPTNLSSSFSTT